MLYAIHTKKLPSFHIVVFNTYERRNPQKSIINWGNYIDTLYIGPVYPSTGCLRWLPAKNPEKRLRLKGENLDDLTRENTTIKNLEIVDFFSFPRSLEDCHSKKLLELISQMKALENLTLKFGETYGISSGGYGLFNREFSQIESLENLKTFDFSFTYKKQLTQISPPYGSQMKNLQTLSL